MVNDNIDSEGSASTQARIVELERELAKARAECESFKRIHEAAPQIVYIFDLLERRTVFRSRHFALDLGYSLQEAEAFGDDVVVKLVHPDDLERLPKLVERRVHAKDPDVVETEFRARHKRGDYRWLLLRDTVFERDESGRVSKVLGVAIDITERKVLERRLATSQKLEALGSLASGIAHDFNNILMMVLGNVELTRAGLAREENPAEFLDQVESAVLEASGLTRQLLSFARNQVAKGQVFAPNKTINETLRLLRRVIGKMVKLNVDLREPMRDIEMDPSQFTQVLMNLAVNARDAMPEGGTLTLKTSVTNVDNADWVKLEVIDDGVGMDEKTLAHAFEQFFTTKSDGQGTGLGLSTVSMVAEQTGGRVSVHSKLGEGTRVEVLLPAHVAPQRAAKPTVIGVPKRSKQRILIVDDEPAVRKIIERLLHREGYEVVSVPNAESALELLSDEPNFDAVITDIMLTGMNGLELAQQIRSTHPELRVLFTSGYPRQLARGRGALPDAVFLAKPFTQTVLAEHVATLLAEPPQRAVGP